MDYKYTIKDGNENVIFSLIQNEKKTCVCTCGAHFVGSQYGSAKCPNCGSHYETKTYIGGWRGPTEPKDTNISAIGTKLNLDKEKINATRIEKTLDVKFEKQSDGEYKINMSERNEIRTEIDYDFLRKERLIVSKNGIKLRTKTEKMKELTGFEINDHVRYGHRDDLFYAVSQMTGSRNIAPIIKILDQHPEIEILYNTYGANKLFSSLDVEWLKHGKTKPHQILGVTRPILKSLMEQNNNSWTLKRNIELAIKISEEYKNKPDIGDSYIRDIISNSLNEDDYLHLIKEKKYERKTLIKYLTEDIYTFQGIDSPKEGLTLLHDYIEMCEEMEVPFVRYPNSLKKAHDVAQKNYKLHVDEITMKKFKENVESEEYQSLESKTLDDYCVLLPKTPDDLKNEGTNLHHCVASYINLVANGNTKILFMRHKKTPEKSLLTLEVRDGRLRQYKGEWNRSPSDKEMEAIKKWAKLKSLAVA